MIRIALFALVALRRHRVCRSRPCRSPNVSPRSCRSTRRARSDAATGRHRQRRPRAHRRSGRERRRGRQGRDLPRARSRRDRHACRSRACSRPCAPHDDRRARHPRPHRRRGHARKPRDHAPRTSRRASCARSPAACAATDHARISRITFDSEYARSMSSRGADLRIARLTFDPRSGRFDVMFELPGSTRARSLRFTGALRRRSRPRC